MQKSTPARGFGRGFFLFMGEPPGLEKKENSEKSPGFCRISYFIARAFTLAITSSISQYLGIFKGFSNNFFLYQNVHYFVNFLGVMTQ